MKCGALRKFVCSGRSRSQDLGFMGACAGLTMEGGWGGGGGDSDDLSSPDHHNRHSTVRAYDHRS